MSLGGPKKLWWWMALLIWAGVIVGAIGILAEFLPIAALADSAFTLLAIGWLCLALAAAVIYLRMIR